MRGRFARTEGACHARRRSSRHLALSKQAFERSERTLNLRPVPEGPFPLVRRTGLRDGLVRWSSTARASRVRRSEGRATPPLRSETQRRPPAPPGPDHNSFPSPCTCGRPRCARTDLVVRPRAVGSDDGVAAAERAFGNAALDGAQRDEGVEMLGQQPSVGQAQVRDQPASRPEVTRA